MIPDGRSGGAGGPEVRAGIPRHHAPQPVPIRRDVALKERDRDGPHRRARLLQYGDDVGRAFPCLHVRDPLLRDLRARRAARRPRRQGVATAREHRPRGMGDGVMHEGSHLVATGPGGRVGSLEQLRGELEFGSAVAGHFNSVEHGRPTGGGALTARRRDLPPVRGLWSAGTGLPVDTRPPRSLWPAKGGTREPHAERCQR